MSQVPLDMDPPLLMLTTVFSVLSWPVMKQLSIVAKTFALMQISKS